METVLITSANKSIGDEMASQIANRGDYVNVESGNSANSLHAVAQMKSEGYYK